jgi:hypothetical protein
MATVGAQEGGRSVNADDVLKKERLKIEVPMIELDDLETIVTGFRASAMSCEHGGVATHGGMGSLFAVTMSWKGRHATITSQELLAAWVRTFNADDAEGILNATISGDSGGDDNVEPNRRSARDRGDEEELVDEDDEDFDEDEEV